MRRLPHQDDATTGSELKSLAYQLAARQRNPLSTLCVLHRAVLEEAEGHMNREQLLDAAHDIQNFKLELLAGLEASFQRSLHAVGERPGAQPAMEAILEPTNRPFTINDFSPLRVRRLQAASFCFAYWEIYVATLKIATSCSLHKTKGRPSRRQLASFSLTLFVLPMRSGW